jgi:hypothetical protein
MLVSTRTKNKRGLGAILRDSNGKIIFSAWGTTARCQSAETAEAIAILEVKSTLPIADKPVRDESNNAAVVNDLISSKGSK